MLTTRVGEGSSSGMDNSYVDVWWPHAGSVIVLVKSHVPSWRPVRMIAVDETSVCVSCITCILAIETASMFRTHPISVPGCGNVKNVHVTFCNSRSVMIGLYILPWQFMKWCQHNGSLLVLVWEAWNVSVGFVGVDWGKGSLSLWTCWDFASRSKTSLDHGPGGAVESYSCIWCTRAHCVFEFGLCRQAWLRTQFPDQDASSCGQYSHTRPPWQLLPVRRWIRDCLAVWCCFLSTPSVAVLKV
jgi:hypothetical protein